METLEKILQEIEECRKISSLNGNFNSSASFEKCEEIIKKHLSCENYTETTRQSRDNGWIPCSERMPENAKVKGGFCPKYQIMTAYGVTEGWYNPDQDGWYALFWFMTDRFIETEISFERGDVPKLIFIPYDGNKIVTAWKPLPESYKPPVESAEEKSMREREEFFKGGE